MPAAPVDPNAQASMIDAIASRRMGVQPEMPAPAPAAPTPQPPAREAETAEGKAVTAGAPVDEGSRMDEDAIAYDVDFGGKKRRLTPQQIASTFARYGDLNHRHATMKPVLDLVDQIMQDNPGAQPQQIAEYVLNLAKQQQNGGPVTPPETKTAASNEMAEHIDPLAQWEKENAATLPPGYKEMMSGGDATRQEMAQIKAMLQQVLATSAGHTDAARASHADARNQQVSAIRQSIANNLDRNQQELGLTDDQAEDFMTFASERGYTMEDFVDPRLTKTVMTDFKNASASPEMERLRAIAQRRQAFTGTMGASPAGPSAAPPAPADKTFNEFTDYAIGKRGV